MKAKMYLMAFTVIAALSSCSQQEEYFLDNGQSSCDGNAVTFGTYIGQAPVSRATSIGTKELKTGAGFGVFAYHTKEADFAEGECLPDFMRNQKVAWNGEGWAYSPLKYWPNNDDHKISFFAYAPYVESAGTINITALPEMGEIDATGKVTKPSDPVIGFTVAGDYKDQVDLLYNDAQLTSNLMKQSIDQKVQFNFRHALSRVGFKAMIIIDEVADKENGSSSGDGSNHKDILLGEGSTVTIDSITFKSADFSKSGSLNLYTGEWDNINSETMEFKFCEDDFIEGSNIFSGSESTVAAEEKSRVVKLTDEYLMLIPNRVGEDGVIEKANIELSVDYTIETLDDKLAGGKTQIGHTITAPFEFEFKKGEAYDFVIHIGLTSVKLDASVNDWGNIDTEISANRTVYESNNYLGTFVMYPYNEQPGLEVTLDGKPAEVYRAKVMYQDKNGTFKYTIPEFKDMTAKYEGSPCSLLGWSTKQYDVMIDSEAALDNLYKSGDTVGIPLSEGLDNFKLYAVWMVEGTN